MPMSATDASYPAPADSGAYEAGITTGQVRRSSHCRSFNWLKLLSKLGHNPNCHCCHPQQVCPLLIRFFPCPDQSFYPLQRVSALHWLTFFFFFSYSDPS